MIHDSGIAVIYRVERDELTPPPAMVSLVEKCSHPFGDKTVGATRFYQAAQAGMRIDRLIEIWRDDTITTRDLCKIGTEYYQINQVALGEDEDGIYVTRLSLTLTDGSVWEAVEHGEAQNQPQ